MAGRAPVLPPGWSLVALDSVGSTNDEARRLGHDGAADCTVVWALEQTAGRGRQGRAWASPRGNLYCSLVLRPPIALRRAAELSFVAALGLGEALAELLPPTVELRYKWPNDVLLNGRKVSGILVESALRADQSIDFLVLGVGVNVDRRPDEARFPATSLKDEGAAAGTGPAAVLEAFARRFQVWADRWRAQGFAPVRQAWQARAWRLNQTLDIRLGARGSVSGRFDGLAEDGALVLSLADGTRRTVAAGDVSAARAGQG